MRASTKEKIGMAAAMVVCLLFISFILWGCTTNFGIKPYHQNCTYITTFSHHDNVIVQKDYCR